MAEETLKEKCARREKQLRALMEGLEVKNIGGAMELDSIALRVMGEMIAEKAKDNLAFKFLKSL